MATKVYKFSATGGFDVNKKFQEIIACGGLGCGFQLPDGRTVRLAIALEVESKNGDSFEYITSEAKMTELGFENLDYRELMFEEGEES